MPSLYGRAAEYATQVVGRVLAALPVSLAAVRQQADEGGSAMDVAIEGDEAAQQGGASAEDDGAAQMGTVGAGLEGSTDGAVGLGGGAAEEGAATEDSTDMDVDAARAAGVGRVEMEVADSTDTTTTRRHRRGKQAKMTSNQRKQMKKLKQSGRDG